jgi:YbbR domain-containing protein
MNISKKFDDILTSPWILWGISVSIAVFMWFYVLDKGAIVVNETRELLSQLEYRNLAPELGIRNAVKEITVKIEAPENVMNQLEYDSILCEVDLRRLSSGKYREIVKATTPPNVRLLSITPSRIDVELIRLAGRMIPVEVTLPQDIPAGRYLEAVEIVPKELNVKGTDRDLAKIGSISITPTFQELEGGKELLLPVKIAQSEPFEDEVTLEPSQVKMNATLVTGLPRKKVAVNVRLSGKPSMDYVVRSVTTDPAEVMLQGTKAKLDAISAIDTETIDITDISEDQTLIVPLRPFRDKDISTVDVQSAKLLIQLEPITAQKQFSGIPIAIEGIDASKAAEEKRTVSPPTADVTVEASPSRMETIDLEALGLKVFVDLSNIFLRRTTLPVRAVTSGDFKIIKIDPSTVTVSTVEE